MNFQDISPHDTPKMRKSCSKAISVLHFLPGWVGWHELCWQRGEFLCTHTQLHQHMGTTVNSGVWLFSDTASTEAAALSSPLQKKSEWNESSVQASSRG